MFETQLQNVLFFLKTNPAFAWGGAALLAASLYFKPKETSKLIAFILFLIAAFYIMTLLIGTVGTGVHEKDGMIYNTRDRLGD